MKQVSRSALVSFSAEQMFHLVNDVARYPEFLPGCSGSRVLELSEAHMVASVDVSKAGISKTFTTSNQLTPGVSIAMSLVDGPFKTLRGGWFFTPLDEAACKVELRLEFEFSSKMIELAFGKIFNELTSNMVNAFTRRAKQVYGE
ncbi:type II toxin-antitoxin system RatA family toxin [Vibrio cholerae]|uniref:SRPBCC family protein n=1 Tax=Vibrio cholerae TaxID=666 RepID=UPI000E0C2F25|nr:type II toxin-antitoxin system RatA family toxin [Vibrio cholerae]EGQ9853900.1 type II toxin-antitoxin system RatA family toxin [Vibrio cholerae]EGR1023613.1 type II toxin-antitoxin system RatA family toxin [Vibrio cholerae]EGR4197849.1 type II toxin-antitoxin system RatA family toxin [Vibrio cholerae]EGR4328477.1 type II toxin-antitoxin system RatA family toxin [Vibrio cholerae]EII3727404.1 type II toxin-antitoxin system RatA family toxin [Vibrio cholerae]